MSAVTLTRMLSLAYHHIHNQVLATIGCFVWFGANVCVTWWPYGPALYPARLLYVHERVRPLTGVIWTVWVIG